MNDDDGQQPSAHISRSRSISLEAIIVSGEWERHCRQFELIDKFQFHDVGMWMAEVIHHVQKLFYQAVQLNSSTV